MRYIIQATLLMALLTVLSPTMVLGINYCSVASTGDCTCDLSPHPFRVHMEYGYSGDPDEPLYLNIEECDYFYDPYTGVFYFQCYWVDGSYCPGTTSSDTVTIIGSPYHDDIMAAEGFYALEAGDFSQIYIYGRDGDDYIYGSEIDETLKGGDGCDEVRGNGGIDWVLVDELNGETCNGAQYADGGSGNDYIIGSRDPDSEDLLVGGLGADFLWGFEGNDVLCGYNCQNYTTRADDGDHLMGMAGQDQMCDKDISDSDDFNGGSETDAIYSFSSVRGDTQTSCEVWKYNVCGPAFQLYQEWN